MKLNRRKFIKATGAAGMTMVAQPIMPTKRATPSSYPKHIDRCTLVRRHNPIVSRFDPFSALSVGNGEFAFTSDVTGLQTFTTQYKKEFPLCTASHWGWHRTPLPSNLRQEDFRYKDYLTYGRAVGYATESKGQEPLFNWLRQNPHRLHLGRIGFELKKADGSVAEPSDLKKIRQTLDLWTGLLESRFELEGKAVQVQTCCDPELDVIAVRIESPLLVTGQLGVVLAFPYASFDMDMADWNKPGRHRTLCNHRGDNRADLERKLDADEYHVSLAWVNAHMLVEKSPHEYLLSGQSRNAMEAVCLFSPKPFTGKLPTVKQTQSAAQTHWQHFWNNGGTVDLSSSTDSRATELERRIVLSLYHTAIHSAGSLPSPESGLLFNSWYGKFHLEMHWWHSVHFTAWGRFSLFEKSLGLYRRILPLAKETAKRQGYRGARWPKMIGPDGHDAPSGIGPLLIWQQPHPIYYAELCYRERPTNETLERWCEIVFASAEFMASYAVMDKKRNQFVLGPPLKTVSENTNPLVTINPTFELSYWRFGLRVAQLWRDRLGLPRNTLWNEVLQGLSSLSSQEGLYLMQQGMTDTYTKWNWEHPALLGSFGMQPGDGVDIGTMRRTVRKVMETWQWDRTWGWDFPMAAMAAARTGETELAVKILLIDAPKNHYLPNGHNYQSSDLPAYLPGNGGLLSAVAMMVGGWTNGPAGTAPGFPQNGKWSVRFEDLKRWL
jgi:hypothetical protein